MENRTPLMGDEKTYELAHRAVTLRALLEFYSSLPAKMPHFDPARHKNVGYRAAGDHSNEPTEPIRGLRCGYGADGWSRNTSRSHLTCQSMLCVWYVFDMLFFHVFPGGWGALVSSHLMPSVAMCLRHGHPQLVQPLCPFGGVCCGGCAGTA